MKTPSPPFFPFGRQYFRPTNLIASCRLSDPLILCLEDRKAELKGRPLFGIVFVLLFTILFTVRQRVMFKQERKAKFQKKIRVIL